MNAQNTNSTRKLFPWDSLRVRLIASYMFLIFISLSIMGIYVYYRTQQSNTYLTEQITKALNEQAESQLRAIAQYQTAQINAFYAEIKNSIVQIGMTLGNALSEEQVLGNAYWDAASALYRLPNGSWDNPNNEVASIFLPANIDLTESLVTELNVLRQMDFYAPVTLKTYPDVVALYFGSRRGATIYYPNIDLAAIVPNDFDITRRPWYVAAAPARNPQRQAVWSAPYLDAALNGLVVTCSAPVYDRQGIFRGVAAMDVQLSRINSIVDGIRVEQTGYAFLIDSEKRLIAMPRRGYQDLGISAETLPLGEPLTEDRVKADLSPTFWAAIADMAAGKSGIQMIKIGARERFVAYQPIPEVGYSLAIVVPTDELFLQAVTTKQEVARFTRNATWLGLFLSAGILVFTLTLALAAGNRLTQPLLALTNAAAEIERGNLETRVETRASGELRRLAQAFNAMTNQLRETITSLEQRVQERTRALERRNEQLRAALEVGSAAVSVRDLESLLSRITHLISYRFGFYHVGIFLVDERGEFAVLRAANSPGGQRMLARGHKLRIGQEGIVGHVTATGEARIARNVGQDAVYFQNPDLPETRSEATLPLIAGKQIIGALDVQSTEEDAFQEEDLITLQVLADQIAIAIENARLLEESQKALEAARRAYGETTRASWRSLLKKKALGYTALSQGKIVPIAEGEYSPEYLQAIQTGETVLSEDKRILYLPITVLGIPIGVLKVKQKGKEIWTEQKIATLSSLVGQMGTALESARLYEQLRDQARREAIIARITSRMRETLDIETVLQTAAQEIRRSLNLQEAEIRLHAPSLMSSPSETSEDPSLSPNIPKRSK